MEKFFHVSAKNKKEVFFILAGIFLFILLLAYIIFSISFLGKKVNEGINLNLIERQPVIRFDFVRLEELKKK